ncbi:MAG: hypothetical protein ACE5OR_03370 [bacterium]
MTTKMVTLSVAFSLLCCLSISYSDALQDRKPEGFPVVEVKGTVSVKSSETATPSSVKVDGLLLPDQLLNLEKGACLKLRRPSGEVVVLDGPAEGTVQDLLSSKKPGVVEFVQKTLKKIPAAKRGEGKVEISTQSAGLTRGAKSRREPMPYIWKIKKQPKKSEK